MERKARETSPAEETKLCWGWKWRGGFARGRSGALGLLLFLFVGGEGRGGGKPEKPALPQKLNFAGEEWGGGGKRAAVVARRTAVEPLSGVLLD